jgi:hypothetical protein
MLEFGGGVGLLLLEQTLQLAVLEGGEGGVVADSAWK